MLFKQVGDSIEMDGKSEKKENLRIVNREYGNRSFSVYLENKRTGERFGTVSPIFPINMSGTYTMELSKELGITEIKYV